MAISIFFYVYQWRSVLNKVKKLIISALFAALCLVSTAFLAFPLPTGYANLGDCFAFMSGFVLGPPWGMAAAGIGCALADLVSGYSIYIPATALLKALIALAGAVSASLVFRHGHKPVRRLLTVLGLSLMGEATMVLGYLAYEYFAMGVGVAAVVSIPANVGQAVVGAVASSAIAEVFFKNRVVSGFVSSNFPKK